MQRRSRPRLLTFTLALLATLIVSTGITYSQTKVRPIQNQGTLSVKVTNEQGTLLNGASLTIDGRTTKLSKSTDASGGASVTLAAGNYQVSASYAGMQPATSKAFVRPGQTTQVSIVLKRKPTSTPVPPTGVPTPAPTITPTPGMSTPEVTPMPEGQALLTGKINNSSLQPIAGATIKAYNAQNGQTFTAQTYANGAFEIFVPSSYRYDIMAEAEGYQRDWRTIYQVAPDSHHTVTMNLNPIVSTGQLSGYIRMPDGQPAVGAVLILRGKPLATDQQGFFSTRLPYGTYWVYGRLDKDGQVYKSEFVEVVLSEPSPPPITLVLQPETTTGTATPTATPTSRPVTPGPTGTPSPFGTLKGKVQLVSGEPYAGAAVQALNVNTNETFRAQTDAQGSFELRLPVGTYEVIALVQGYTSEKHRVGIPATGVPSTTTITLFPTSPPSGTPTPLPATPEPTVSPTGTGTLVGQVRTVTGQPYPHAVVRAYNSLAYYTQADANGAFTLQMPAGITFEVTALVEGYTSSQHYISLTANSQHTVDITLSQQRTPDTTTATPTITPTPGTGTGPTSPPADAVILRGDVVMTNMQRVEGATVAVKNEQTGQWFIAQTGAQGTFSLEVSRGTYLINAWYGSYSANAFSLDVTDERSVTLMLYPPHGSGTATATITPTRGTGSATATATITPTPGTGRTATGHGDIRGFFTLTSRMSCAMTSTLPALQRSCK